MKNILALLVYMSVVSVTMAQNKIINGQLISGKQLISEVEFEQMQMFDFDLSCVKNFDNGTYELILAPNQKWLLHLEKSTILSTCLESERLERTHLGGVHYTLCKGYVGDDKSNIVRLTFINNTISGFILDRGKVYRFLPLRRFSGEKSDSSITIVYTQMKSDFFNNPGGDDDVIITDDSEVSVTKSVNYSEDVYILRLAIEGDYEYYQNHLSSAEADLLSAVNDVEGLYNSTFNIIFKVVHLNIYTSSNDPYTVSFDKTLKTQYLSEISNHFANDFPGVYYDVAYMFSGKQRYPTKLYGFADQPGSYGTVADTSEVSTFFAHELGHSLNGSHDYANTTYPISVMYRYQPVWGTLYFTDVNIARINANISNRLIKYSYVNNGVQCSSSGAFSVSNIPSSFSVTWPKSSNLSFSGNSTGSPVTIAGSLGSDAWVQPTLSRGNSSNTVEFPKDEFFIGAPSFSISGDDELEILSWGSAAMNFGESSSADKQSVNSYQWSYTGPINHFTTHNGLVTYQTGSQEGSGTIYGTASNSCGSTQKYLGYSVTGGFLLSISPNPASTEVSISIEEVSPEKTGSLIPEWELEVYSTMQRLKTKQTKIKTKEIKLNTQGWKEGVYTVRARYKGEVLTVKLVVK